VHRGRRALDGSASRLLGDRLAEEGGPGDDEPDELETAIVRQGWWLCCGVGKACSKACSMGSIGFAAAQLDPSC
jgi:hypothetical protein